VRAPGGDDRGDEAADDMVKIRIVNMRNEQHDVRIDRRTCYGNPFVIGKDGTREGVILKCESRLKEQPWIAEKLMHEICNFTQVRRVDEVRLGCWCAPRACHGDTLKRLVEELMDD